MSLSLRFEVPLMPGRRLRLGLSLTTFLVLYISGCGPRVVYQPTRGPVRLAEDVAARVYVKSLEGRWVKGENKVLLHEGEYVLDLPAR